jgi:radical SAM superfamily enzyme YgiQ (UPF0313 family)
MIARRRMKILLISPPLLARFRSYPVPPLGVAHLAAAVAARHETRIIDLNIEPRSERRLLAEIARFAPDVVGMSAATPTYPHLLRLAGRIQEAVRARIVFGGSHVTALPRAAMRRPEIDFVLRGEADASFPAFADAFSPGRAAYDVPGLAYRDAAGAVVENPCGPLVDDLDSLPFPAFDLLPMRRYRGRLRAFASTLLSRGCPFGCTYCAAHLTHGRRVRRRGLDHVMGELALLERRHGVAFLAIFDDTFTADRDFAAAFCERKLRESLRLEFWCNTRVGLVDPELLALMKRAGCAVISYGLESGSDETLRAIRKGTTVEQAREAVALTREAGIIPEGFLMLNFPGETEAEMRRTIRLAFELELPFFEIVSATPYPGTEYARECAEKGLLPDDACADFGRYWVVDDVVVDHGLVAPRRVRRLMAKARRRMILRPLFWKTMLGYFLRGARPALADVAYYLGYVPRLLREIFRAG